MVMADGRSRYCGGVFLERCDDGGIILHTAGGEVRYDRHEYKCYFLDDIQQSWYAAGQPSADRWKLNPERSRLLQSSTLKGRTLWIVESGPGRWQDRFEEVNQDGSRGTHTEPIREFDGREHPIQELGAGYTEVCEVIDDSTERITRNKDGEVVMEIIHRLSADGQTLTSLEKKLTGDGQTFEAEFVYEKL